MRISIFEGRKANYNRAVLKLLIEKEPLKAWDISKHIAKGSMDKTQDVYATLIRKNGRLRELSDKEYVVLLPNKRYSPTFKGIIAYLLTEKNPEISSFYHNLFSKIEIPEKVNMPFLNIPINTEFISEVKELTLEELLEFKPLIRNCLEKFDLDAFSNGELFMILTVRLNKALMKKVKELLKEVIELLKKFGSLDKRKNL